jgi:CYTH domain-containing protein
MALEIERKFLVKPQLWNDLIKPEGLICQQTYLLKDDFRTVRVRVLGEKGFITFKGKTIGFSKPEFEYEIPLSEAKEMIQLFGEVTIEKTRFLFPQGRHTWEVDVFFGDNH